MADTATAFIIRPYAPADAGPIAHLFYNTIRTVSLRDYTPEQVAVWAGDEIRPDRWAAKLGSRATFVAEAVGSGDILGFTDLESDGHLDHMFVHHEHQRQGIAAALHASAEAEARRTGVRRLYTEASLTARPFFLRMGYVQVRQQTVEIRGVGLTNFVMEKPLANGEPV